MKIIKVIYNSECSFILEILRTFKEIALIESYNTDVFKENKSAIPIQTRFGTKNLPLLVFCDENQQEVDALWSENNPEWKRDIKYKLKKLYEL